ncbi:MAG: TIGR02530 family flagellar biosynthesis protein [bacterium]|jgi:flagellar operon protein
MSDNKVFLPPPIITPTLRLTAAPGKPSSQGVTAEGKDFAAYLSEAKGLKLSHHARERLSVRQIPFTAETWSRVLTAVDKVAEKGGRDSLVLLGDLALVVNVPNRTVITAVDGPNMKERVFTNIDSAVIA